MVNSPLIRPYLLGGGSFGGGTLGSHDSRVDNRYSLSLETDLDFGTMIQ